MKNKIFRLVLLASTILLGVTRFVPAQNWNNARVAFYAQTASSPDPLSSGYNELVTTFTIASAIRDDPGTEYGVDLRASTYPSSNGRDSRFSIYNAYVGQRFGNGLLVRGGQMWLNELGALGSFGGGMAQYKRKHGNHFLRFGGFYGLEPEILQAGYVQGIHKYGGFFSFDGQNGGSSSLGYVTVRNNSLVERSVLVFSNFIPAGNKFFLYQNAEYDLVGPAGLNLGTGLNYFFISSRFDPNRTFEILGTYHRGRSIDTRSIVDAELNGRPVDSSLLTGLLYESFDGRFTVSLGNYLRVFAGYGRDLNNQGELPLNRLDVGATSSNLMNSGFDFSFSLNHWTGSFPHDGFSFSVGKSLGKSVYISGDYSSSVSVFTFTSTDGVIIQNRPSSRLFGASANINLNRNISLHFTGQRTTGDDLNENRFLAGIAYRF